MFPDLLEHLADKFDQVIIDAPPVLGVSDARIIAASCDITLLVVRNGASGRRKSLLARDSLTGMAPSFSALIVTHVARGQEISINGQLHPGKRQSTPPTTSIPPADPDPDDIIDIGASSV